METPAKFDFKKLSISQSANSFYVKYDNKPISFKFVNAACTNIIKPKEASKEDIISTYKEGGYLKQVFDIHKTNNVIFSVTVFDDK
jgi:hypothetical protein